MSKSLILLQKENLELSKENTALKETVTKLLEELNKARELPARTTNKSSQTPELQIIDEQIRYFNAISAQRAMSLEETRAFDLFVKNKRILEAEKPIEPPYTPVAEPSEEELLKLAGNTSDDPAKT